VAEDSFSFVGIKIGKNAVGKDHFGIMQRGEFCLFALKMRK